MHCAHAGGGGFSDVIACFQAKWPEPFKFSMQVFTPDTELYLCFFPSHGHGQIGGSRGLLHMVGGGAVVNLDHSNKIVRDRDHGIRSGDFQTREKLLSMRMHMCVLRV